MCLYLVIASQLACICKLTRYLRAWGNHRHKGRVCLVDTSAALSLHEGFWERSDDPVACSVDLEPLVVPRLSLNALLCNVNLSVPHINLFPTCLFLNRDLTHQKDRHVCSQVRQQDTGRTWSNHWVWTLIQKNAFFHLLSFSFPVSAAPLCTLFVFPSIFFWLSLYRRPLTPATAAVVGRLSSQGRLKIARDRTRESLLPHRASWNACASTACLANCSHGGCVWTAASEDYSLPPLWPSSCRVLLHLSCCTCGLMPV